MRRMTWEWIVAALALAVAAALRPWRLPQSHALPWPWLACWAALPLLWTMDLATGTLAVQPLSGASLLVLLAGWPLATLAMAPAALLAAWLAPMAADAAVHRYVWFGLLPGTLALLLGAAVRRFLPNHLMVYILGRGFFATWLACGLAAAAGGLLHPPGGGLATDDLLLARWLAASGEAVLTGMIVSIFVAFRPEWLATYTDRLYLPR